MNAFALHTCRELRMVRSMMRTSAKLWRLASGQGRLLAATMHLERALFLREQAHELERRRA